MDESSKQRYVFFLCGGLEGKSGSAHEEWRGLPETQKTDIRTIRGLSTTSTPGNELGTCLRDQNRAGQSSSGFEVQWSFHSKPSCCVPSFGFIRGLPGGSKVEGLQFVVQGRWSSFDDERSIVG
jgi:hypothetical protein